MITKKRLLQLFLTGAAGAAALGASMRGWNIFSEDYPGGPALTDAAALKAAVTELAVNIGPRDLYNNKPRLRRAEEYIAARFKAAGCAVEYQEYLASGVKVRNIACVKPGASLPGETVVVGAHYDTFDNPGADDNASGTAGVLALADRAKAKKYARTVKFVAFANEEPPFFRHEGMGSKVWADAAADRKENIKAALVLEMIGYFSERRFSQKYPPLVGLFLPDRGNFIAQVSNMASKDLAGRADRVFREATELPLRTVSLPSFVRGADFSDHCSFWAQGWPAVMFTDTSFYRTPNYHKASDLPGTLDFNSMAAVVDGVGAVLDDLAG